MIAQLYAPIDNSQFHRTLYIFTCISPVCSNQSDSWICIRSQILENVTEKEGKKVATTVTQPTNISWLGGVDEWDDVPDDNMNEENGNLTVNDSNKVSDEDDETNSNEFDPIPFFSNLSVNNAQNANFGAQGGAIGQIRAPNPSAEIEGGESEVIMIDTPVIPQRDLIALLKQTSAIPSNLENVSIRGFFLAVDEERLVSGHQTAVSDHVRELIQNYQMTDGGGSLRTTPTSPDNAAYGGPEDLVDSSNSKLEGEQYEKVNPAHGDHMFFSFLSRIQENPGQIVRYSRDASPLLIKPIYEEIPRCRSCGKDVICEVQILPSLISKLQLENGDAVPIEYGNVLIFTCKQSCWDTPDKYRVENVVVQQEL